MKQYGNNELVPMTRRYPNLKRKVLERDSKISAKIIKAWDIEHDSQKVLDIFIKENKNLSDERYWELLRTVWIVCGKLENVDLFRQLMKSTRKERYYFSTSEEQERLRRLPGVFTIYRATNNKNDGGISWTLSEEYAHTYSQLFAKNTILKREVLKSEIFAFIERNKESEIIIL
jgi:hypothetical protein